MKLEEVKNFLKIINVDKYTIHDDLSVSVYEDVTLTHLSLTKIPINFRYVSGFFNCSFNNLTTLEGCPDVIGGDFNCCRNYFEKIDFFPKRIGGDVYFLMNTISEFNYPFESVGGLVYIDDFVLIECDYRDLTEVEYDNHNAYYILYNYNKYSNYFKRKNKLKKILEYKN